MSRMSTDAITGPRTFLVTRLSDGLAYAATFPHWAPRTSNRVMTATRHEALAIKQAIGRNGTMTQIETT